MKPQAGGSRLASSEQEHINTSARINGKQDIDRSPVSSAVSTPVVAPKTVSGVATVNQSVPIVVSHPIRWQNAEFQIDDNPASVIQSSIRFTKLLVAPGSHTLTAVIAAEKCVARFSTSDGDRVSLNCD